MIAFCQKLCHNIRREGDFLEWFNLFGSIFVAALLVPNIIYALTCKDTVENNVRNKFIEILEQIGRFGCIAFMIFNVPGTFLGWSSGEMFAIYLIVDSILVILYCVLWMTVGKKNDLFRALSLSIVPSILFLFSAITSHSLLLFISSLIFAPTHIYISCKNCCH